MRTRPSALVGLLAAALVLTACSGDDTTAGRAAGDQPATGVEAAFNGQDQQFAAGMRAHHAQAVEMADMVLASDPTPEVADLAERIKAAQAPEIAELDEMLAAMGAEAAPGSGHGSAHGADAPMHDGMMTDHQMQMLESADGIEACRLFLEQMEEHHAGAVTSAETQLSDGRHARLREIAQAIVETQSAEIEEMRQLRAQL